MVGDPRWLGRGPAVGGVTPRRGRSCPWISRVTGRPQVGVANLWGAWPTPASRPQAGLFLGRGAHFPVSPAEGAGRGAARRAVKPRGAAATPLAPAAAAAAAMRAVVQRVTRASVTGQSGGAGPGGAAPDPAPAVRPAAPPPPIPRAVPRWTCLSRARRLAPRPGSGRRSRPRWLSMCLGGGAARPWLQDLLFGLRIHTPHYSLYFGPAHRGADPPGIPTAGSQWSRAHTRGERFRSKNILLFNIRF